MGGLKRPQNRVRNIGDVAVPILNIATIEAVLGPDYGEGYCKLVQKLSICKSWSFYWRIHKDRHGKCEMLHVKFDKERTEYIFGTKVSHYESKLGYIEKKGVDVISLDDVDEV